MAELNWETIWQQLDDLGAAYSNAKADVVYLSEFKKSKRALLMKEFEASNPGATGVLQEREARSNPEYLELLQGLKAATEIEAQAKHKLDTLKLRIEVWRTRQATRRAEANLR